MITDRLNEIGKLPDPNLAELIRPAAKAAPEPASGAASTDEERDTAYIDHRKQDIDACDSIAALREYTNRPGLKAKLDEMLETEHGKALVKGLHAYAHQRYLALGGKS